MLWLNDNRISSLKGLQRLAALRDLNVAGNPLETVAGVLDCNPGLEVLNLAGTLLACLRQVQFPKGSISHVAVFNRLT